MEFRNSRRPVLLPLLAKQIELRQSPASFAMLAGFRFEFDLGQVLAQAAAELRLQRGDELFLPLAPRPLKFLQQVSLQLFFPPDIHAFEGSRLDVNVANLACSTPKFLEQLSCFLRSLLRHLRRGHQNFDPANSGPKLVNTFRSALSRHVGDGTAQSADELLGWSCAGFHGKKLRMETETYITKSNKSTRSQGELYLLMFSRKIPTTIS